MWIYLLKFVACVVAVVVVVVDVVVASRICDVCFLSLAKEFCFQFCSWYLDQLGHLLKERPGERKNHLVQSSLILFEVEETIILFVPTVLFLKKSLFKARLNGQHFI